MNFKVLNTIGEDFADKGKAMLGEIGEVTYKKLSQEELLECVGEYDAVITGLGLIFNSEVLERGKKLRFIATATTGTDHIDLDYAKNQGIEILSLKGETEFLNTITGTAELAFCLMLELVRGTQPAFASVKEYRWDRESFKGMSLFGKTLGIVGLGRLGKMMAKYGVAFGMEVIFTDPNETSFPNAKKVTFDELIKESDIVSIHVHLTAETENMFSTDEFKKMKESAYLVNTSRGKIVDESALLKALENGDIAGYGTDVLSGELDFDKKDIKGYPLIEYAKKHSNLIITPHIGGMTVDSRTATDIFISKKLIRHLAL